MERRIKAINFDIGILPVDNPNSLDFIGISDYDDYTYPGQFMITRRGHKRTLEMIIHSYKDDSVSAKMFATKSSFAYWKPEIDNKVVKDRMLDIDYTTYTLGILGLGHKIISKPSGYVFGGDMDDFFGKALGYYSKKPNKFRVIPLSKDYYDFYSMDNEMKIHNTRIKLKYIPRKDLVKFDVLYDEKTRMNVYTNGDYNIKYIKQPYNERSKNGNLLSEKDFTLYLDERIPIKVHAEVSNKNS